jgi:hypothetical protein
MPFSPDGPDRRNFCHPPDATPPAEADDEPDNNTPVEHEAPRIGC